MSQAGLPGRRHEGTPIEPVGHSLDRPLRSQSAFPASTMMTTCYTSGCSELDGRVLGGRLNGVLSGGLVGLSAEGDIGIALSLQVAVEHLHQNVTATTRLITTLPVAHVVRLLRGVLKGALRTANSTEDEGAEKIKLSSSSKASILGRVLISRIYGHDDLQAVLNELESGVPFQRLWSTSGRRNEDEQTAAQQMGDTTSGESSGPEHSAPPSIVILTEMDHHFKWMRLQSNGGRLYELYGQLMRRLRALAAIRPPNATTVPGRASFTTTSRPLVIVLNNTLTRRPEEAPIVATADDGASGVVDDSHRAAPPQTIDYNTTYRLALTALQARRHSGRPEVFRLCCGELARAQCVEPQYKTLLDYFCSLHVCFTRLPVDLVDMWGGTEGGSMSPADSSLWVPQSTVTRPKLANEVPTGLALCISLAASCKTLLSHEHHSNTSHTNKKVKKKNKNNTKQKQRWK